MAHWSRALSLLSEDLSSAPSISGSSQLPEMPALGGLMSFSVLYRQPHTLNDTCIRKILKKPQKTYLFTYLLVKADETTQLPVEFCL